MKTGVAYFGSRDPRHVRTDLEDMRKHHCNMVIHTFSEEDYNFYALVMKEIVSISHELGFEVYIDPWGVGGVFGGEAFSRFVMQNPGECQRLASGAPAPAACLNSPAFLAFMKSWVDFAATAGADIVFWDEPHFYITPTTWIASQKSDEWACACDRCRGLFRQKFGRDLPVAMDGDVIAFRDESIVSFFKTLTEYSQKTHSMKNALCVLPDENPLMGVSSWDLLASLPSISIFGTDPYWMLWNKPLLDYVRASTRRIIDICSRFGKEPQMWVQAFLIYEGREEEVGQVARIMAQEGIKNIAAWSYRGGAYMNLKSVHHEQVWKILGEAFGEMRK